MKMPSEESWGRFTRYGSAELEARITALVAEAAGVMRAVLSPKEYRAALLIGGYGRGEGGVEVIDGIEHPHNNLDFLVITVSTSKDTREALRQRLLEALLPVALKCGIEIDLSTIDAWKLRMSASLVIWYDMRFGHKTVLGDSSLVPSLRHFRADRIPAWDVRNLLVNRGTLLLVNEEIMASERVGGEHRKRIVRNNMKAIIGYGDALLYFLGEYDWSYAERQRRMRGCKEVPGEFRDLYEEAIEFRFRPDYARYMDQDLSSWTALLRKSLEPIHQFCEGKRLGITNLNWVSYPQVALSHAVLEDGLTLRGWAKKFVNLARRERCNAGYSRLARLGFHCLGKKDVYPILFPALAYRVQDPRFLEFAADVLQARSARHDGLRKAYLSLWNETGDINGFSILRRWRMPVAQENQRA